MKGLIPLLLVMTWLAAVASTEHKTKQASVPSGGAVPLVPTAPSTPVVRQPDPSAVDAARAVSEGPFPESESAPTLSSFYSGSVPAGAGISELNSYVAFLMKKAEARISTSELAAFQGWWSNQKWEVLGQTEAGNMKVPTALNLAFAQYQNEKQTRDRASRLYWLKTHAASGWQTFCSTTGGKCAIFAVNNPLTRGTCRAGWFLLTNPVSRYFYGVLILSTGLSMASEVGSPITRVPIQVAGRLSTRLLSGISSWWNSFLGSLAHNVENTASSPGDKTPASGSLAEHQPMFYDLQQLQSSLFASDVDYGRSLFKQYHLDIPSMYVNSLLTTDTHYRLLREEEAQLDKEFKQNTAAGSASADESAKYHQRRQELNTAIDQDIDRTAALMAIQQFIESISPEVNPPASLRDKYPLLKTYQVLMKSMHADAFATEQVMKRRDLILKELQLQEKARSKS